MGLADKIVEKYSEELVRAYPIQKIFSAFSASLILWMVKDGTYLSALESVFQLSLRDLFLSSSVPLNITLGTLSCAVVLVTIASFLQGKATKKISHFLTKGFDLVALSQKLHSESKSINLPLAISTELASECSAKLKRKTVNLARQSSIAEFFFIVGIAEIAAAVYGKNAIDLIFSTLLLLLWMVIRGWLVFRFIEEILPLEAHLFGIRGIPYNLTIENGE